MYPYKLCMYFLAFHSAPHGEMSYRSLQIYKNWSWYLFVVMLQLNTLQELFLNLLWILCCSYKMYSFGFLYKLVLNKLIQPYWFIHTKCMAFISYHHQKLWLTRKAPKKIGENYEPRCNFKLHWSTNHFQSNCLTENTSLETLKLLSEI